MKTKTMRILVKISILMLLSVGISSCDFGNPFRALAKEDLNPGKVANTKKWQEKLSGNRKVSNVLLPGTHDTGTFKGSALNPLTGGIIAKTQNYNIKEQLEIGVRAFDIRLGASGNDLRIYHGPAYQKIKFNRDILDKCINFLKENPSEFLILVIKQETGDDTAYKKLLNDRLQINEYKKYIVQSFKSNLTVDQIRGKMIFLHRTDIGKNTVSGTIKGWANNSTFKGIIQNSSNQITDLYIEDQYSKDELSTNQKWDVTRANLEASARNGNLNDWFITFASFSGSLKKPAFPSAEADIINPKIISHLKNNKARGILFVDYAEINLTKSIINANF